MLKLGSKKETLLVGEVRLFDLEDVKRGNWYVVCRQCSIDGCTSLQIRKCGSLNMLTVTKCTPSRKSLYLDQAVRLGFLCTLSWTEVSVDLMVANCWLNVAFAHSRWHHHLLSGEAGGAATAAFACFGHKLTVDSCCCCCEPANGPLWFVFRF